MKKSLLFLLEQASRDKPVTRQDIRSMFRCCDRVARNMIEQLRDQGYPVVGISNQEGYWIAKTEQELQVFLRNYGAKARTIQRRSERMAASFYQERMM